MPWVGGALAIKTGTCTGTCLVFGWMDGMELRFNFPISQSKHMLWVLKKTEYPYYPKQMLKLIDNKMITNFR